MRNIAFASFAMIVLATPQIHAAPAASRVVVHYGDLNLASAEGRDVLQRRLKLAARNACGSSPDLRSPIYRVYEHCVSDAYERALIQVQQLRLADAAR